MAELIPIRLKLAGEQVSTIADADVIPVDGVDGVRLISHADYKAELAEAFAGAPTTFNPATSTLGGLVKVNTSEAPGVTPIVYKKSEFDARLARVNVLDYGAIGNGIADDTAAVAAAYAALDSTNGGELFFPVGKWKFNLVVTKPNVTITGVSHIKDPGTVGFTSFFLPTDVNSPVIQIGNDTGYVRGALIRNVTLNGQNAGALGIYFAGGAVECAMENSVVIYFATNIKVLGGTTYPASKIQFTRVHGQPANVTNGRGWLIKQTPNYPTSYTTEIVLDGCDWDGPASASGSYVLEVDSVEIKIDNSYHDVHGGHGWKISNTLGATALPWIDGINTNVDSGAPSNVAIEGYDNARNYTSLSTVNFQVNGKFQDLDGTPLSPGIQPITILRRGSAVRGIFQILGSAGNCQIIFTDLVNGKAPDIFTQSSGTINIRADNGGGVKLGGLGGAVGLQVNYDGSVFLLGPSLTADTGLYLDSNRQVKSATVTITAPGTTGAQTINKNLGRVNFAAGAQTLVVTNSLVTTSTIILPSIKSDDATAKSVIISAQSAGSFTLKLNAAATAETAVNFAIFNGA